MLIQITRDYSRLIRITSAYNRLSTTTKTWPEITQWVPIKIMVKALQIYMSLNNGNNNNMNNKMVRQYDRLDIIVPWPTCSRNHPALQLLLNNNNRTQFNIYIQPVHQYLQDSGPSHTHPQFHSLYHTHLPHVMWSINPCCKLE